MEFALEAQQLLGITWKGALGSHCSRSSTFTPASATRRFSRASTSRSTPARCTPSWGPNGSGKSTLAQVLAGHPAYKVTRRLGHLRRRRPARAGAGGTRAGGIFLAFQYPVEIPGVTNAYFLRAAYNEMRKARGLEEVDPLEFLDLVESGSSSSTWSRRCCNRSVNAGFSGGEKKRNEILQMAVLEPRLAILDETDSGLDIDALRIVANGVNALRRPDNATIVVTHYQRLLNYIMPDFVHVLAGGRIVKSGGKELAARARGRGYDWLVEGPRRSGRAREVQHYVDEFADVAATGGRILAGPDSAAGGHRPVPRARVPYQARRGLALHECHADCGRALHATSQPTR